MRGEICAFSSSDDVLAPCCAWHKQYGFLRLANFVAGGDRATILDAAQLTHLAYGSFKVSDSLGWDVCDTSKLLACLSSSFVAASTSSVVT